MQKDLHDSRKSYEKDALLESNLSQDPFKTFEQWFRDAENSPGVEEANAMIVSTISKDGFPKSRVVLLKEIEEGSFLFYTNYTSEKAEAIDSHPKIGVHFFWPALERQIMMKCHVERVGREKSLAYFNSRPRGSQLGAWASDQSETIISREALEAQLAAVEKRFENQEVPIPEFWGGYKCTPVCFEFWQGRPNRLHDRILYTQEEDAWSFKRLQP
ncbi:pyridoxamine 5'-phosphate oxidase [Nonlabens marinus]|uniref:Pyridoxine/pyridoxamine 5'-phosphate oxidase n=1 Tax=Nonlabens marinus S1-08 TaxID=1454201 RepID=W8VXX2_9FLAO|nr:pyridoxamine 5'-phosphate oxidase [Nonlabens marinus]BAO56672.1 pyridoxamine 5'-phosphate oxidase [Nonlabens marinus S1-08]